MKPIEKKFKWNEGEAKVYFNLSVKDDKATAINIRIEKSSAEIELPELPVIVENQNRKEIFRADRYNKEQGHTFEYFDNKYADEIIAFIHTKLKSRKH